MKFVLSFFLLFSGAAFAANLKILHGPANPIVITTPSIDDQGNPLTGWWFQVALEYQNLLTTPIVIEEFFYRIKSVEGVVVHKVYKTAATEIQPGHFSAVRISIDEIGKSVSFNFEVTVEVRGYEGTIANPGRAVSARHVFKTQ